MTVTPSAAPTPALDTQTAGGALRLRNAAVLRLHRLADRFEQLPPEFGAETEVDETNANAVVAEWIRCLRLWAAYSPEQVFALKVGAALLVAAIVGLWICIGVMT
jgi:hypothetical protein